MADNSTSTLYRHELKYYLSFADYMILSKRLRATLPSDRNVGSTGEYFIRSLYFDDLSDSAFRDKLDGVDHRDKYRVRTYGLNKNIIKLERKRKDSGYIRKDSINLSFAEYEKLMRGSYNFLYERDEPFARALYVDFKTRLMLPRVIVDYMREPYVFPLEDTRITFDKNIRTAYHATDMFDPRLATYPTLPAGEMVLEIKYNKSLSNHIIQLLQTTSPRRCAISKYVICRKYEL